MSDAAIAEEMQAHVAAVAGPRAWGQTREAWLAQASYRLGFTFNRTRDLFYKRAKAIRAMERDRAASLVSALRQRQQEGIQHGDTLRAATRGWASAWRGVAAVGSGDAVPDGEPVADERGRATDESRQEVLTGWGFRLGRARGEGE